MSLADRRLKAFIYLNAEKTPLYRAMMTLFVEAKSHFEIHLRPAELVSGLRRFEEFDGNAESDVENGLDQLCCWGNLRRTRDTSDVRTVEEFYRPRYLYQLTMEGEAAEQAVRAYEENILRPGELQTAALGVIRDQLKTLLVYIGASQFDVKKIHLTLSTLKNYFDQLTTKSQPFIGSIQRAVDLHGHELQVFIAYKERLFDYLERFIGELVTPCRLAASLDHRQLRLETPSGWGVRPITKDTFRSLRRHSKRHRVQVRVAVQSAKVCAVVPRPGHSRTALRRDGRPVDPTSKASAFSRP